MKVRYRTEYLWRGYTVVIPDGAWIRRISGYGALDTPIVPIRIVSDPRDGYLNGQLFEVGVTQLEEVAR